MDPGAVVDVAAGAVEPPAVVEIDPMDLALQWIGFDSAATRERLRIEGFNAFDDLKALKEKDIRDLAESYGRRTITDGRFIFGLRRIRYLIGLIHWVQDFGRVGQVPTIVPFGEDAAAFRQVLDIAFDRAEVRRIEKEQSDTVSKAADPGKFKDERKWPEWEPAFCNYLSTIPGVSGVPLSYVVRELGVPDPEATYESFNEQAIACSPLEGAVFQADARKVHQLIKSFLQTETAEQWVKPIAKKQNGRADMEALRNHYSGEGNTSRRIAVAERIRDTLFYKSERAMQFSAFLDKMQKMFNIFEEENEQVTEQAKVRMLLKKVEHPQLQDACSALRIRASMEGITFTECANHLSAQVSELPDQQSTRKISGTGSDRSKGSDPKRIRGGGPGNGPKGIHMPDGSVWTGFYSDWNQLDRQTVMETRKANKSKSSKKDNNKVNKYKDTKAKVAELKRSLAAIQSKQSGACEVCDDDDSDAPDNAGDSFGGRQKKKQKKERLLPVVSGFVTWIAMIFRWWSMYCETATRRRIICAHDSSARRQTSTRRICKVRRDSPIYSRMELDSHADTVVLGRNYVILSYTGRECDVSPYNETYESIKGVPIVSGATAWTCETTGLTYILVFNEALWMGDSLDHSLVNPNQLRSYGVVVQDNPFDSTQMHISTEDDTTLIPLKADGTTIYMNTRTPSDHELQTCPHVVLTSKAPWDPRAVSFPQPTHLVEEGKLAQRVSQIRSSRSEAFNSDDEFAAPNLGIYDVSCLTERLIAEVNVTDVMEDVPSRRTFISKDRHSQVSPEELSERWGIGLQQAKNTIKITTQKGVRSAILPLSRRYRADRVFERPLLRGDFYTDTMDARAKSLEGNKYAQVFANRDLFAIAYPMSTKSAAGDGLRQFIHDFGRPERLTFDGSQEQCGRKTEFMKNIRQYSVDYHVTEPERPNHNFAESVIREIMVKKRVPRRLWDYGLRWVCDIQNRTSNSSRGLDGRCPLERITGESVDISEYLDFGFFDRVWYKENAGLGETKMGRWLGVSHRVGSLMSYWVLTEECRGMSRTTVQRATNLEIQTDEVKARCQHFDDRTKRLNTGEDLPYGDAPNVNPADWGDNPHEFDQEFQDEFDRVVSDPMLPEADEQFTPDIYDDTYLNMELALPRSGGEVELG